VRATGDWVAQLATANLKAALKTREDAVKEDGERRMRDVERAMRERADELDTKLKALHDEQRTKSEQTLRQLTEEADRCAFARPRQMGLSVS
jgi:hypothetical protein